MNTVRDNLMYCDLVSRNGIIHKVGVDGNCFRIVDAEGIPITPEILVKNGFDPETFLTYEWGRKVYFKEFLCCVIEPAYSGKYIFGTTKYWSKTYSDGSPIDWGTMYESRIYNLRYVHTLQQALRLVGLSEIADNFKI